MGEVRLEKRKALPITAAIAIAALFSAVAWQAAHWRSSNGALSFKSDAREVLYASSADGQRGGENEDRDADFLAGDLSADTESSKAADLSGSSDGALLAVAPETIGVQLLGQYVALKQAGRYTPDAGERIGRSVAASMRYVPVFERYDSGSFKRSSDDSYEGVLAYRAALREALAPLLENRTAELDLYARFVETGDEANLAALAPIAERYRHAAENAVLIAVPDRGLDEHARAVNALLAFAAVLEGMEQYGADPFAGAVLVQTYNAAEKEVFFAFDALAAHFASHSQNL